jgi:outer membrane lipase/esterase
MPPFPNAAPRRLTSRLLAAGATLALAAPAAAQEASPYGRMVVFGDSISDGGAYGAKAPAGAGSFTTNPDPVWVEVIASGIGLPLTTHVAGGDNYAEGGARVKEPRPDAPGDLPRTPVVNQIDAFLAKGGTFDPGTLVIIQGGGNDVFATQTNGLGFTPIDLAVLDQAALDLAAQVKRVEEAGSATIVTVSVPKFEVFNSRYRSALAATGANVLYFDVAALIAEIETNPGEFGIVNTTDRACRGTALDSFRCLPGTYVTPDANRTYLYADNVHFTGVVHEIEGDAVLAALRAPSQVGQLPFTAHTIMRSTQDGLAEFGRAEPARGGGWTLFGWAEGGQFDIDTRARANGLDGDTAAATVGAMRTVRPGISVGGAFSWSQTDGEFGSDTGGFDLRTVTVTAMARAERGPFDAALHAAYGDLAFDDVERRVVLGPAGRIEAGDTNGRTWSAGAEVGLTRQAGDFTVRPLAGLRYEHVTVGAYAEAGARSTQITFGKQTVESLTASLGAEVGWAATETARPFARLSYEADLLDEAQWLTITPSGAPVSFTSETFRPDDSYFAYAVGVTAELQAGLSGSLLVSGTFGRGAMDSTALRAGVRGRF